MPYFDFVAKAGSQHIHDQLQVVLVVFCNENVHALCSSVLMAVDQLGLTVSRFLGSSSHGRILSSNSTTSSGFARYAAAPDFRQARISSSLVEVLNMMIGIWRKSGSCLIAARVSMPFM